MPHVAAVIALVLSPRFAPRGPSTRSVFFKTRSVSHNIPSYFCHNVPSYFIALYLVQCILPSPQLPSPCFIEVYFA